MASVPHVERLKVDFALEQDASGWPPAGSERVWAVRVGTDRARLDNVPFFVRGYAVDDVVRFETDEDGVHWVREAVRYSANCTIRVIPARDGPEDESGRAVLEALAPFGVTGEGIAQLGMVALNVPEHADVPAVKRFLIEGEGDGRWQYEEGCVTDAWRSAA
ncbi:hypothetical protein GCM10009838_38560 [Catenulispora subtropica]|uniref:DUF4265 domain-containing protein n=2 Tax=Catenulispora subtropica TaxID=450798 RepID=A0ABN2RTZ5_9ACTN